MVSGILPFLQFGCCGVNGTSLNCMVTVPTTTIYGQVCTNLNVYNNLAILLSLSLSLSQGCLPYLSNNVLSYLYNIGAIGMGFATFEVQFRRMCVWCISVTCMYIYWYFEFCGAITMYNVIIVVV